MCGNIKTRARCRFYQSRLAPDGGIRGEPSAVLTAVQTRVVTGAQNRSPRETRARDTNLTLHAASCLQSVPHSVLAMTLESICLQKKQAQPPGNRTSKGHDALRIRKAKQLQALQGKKAVIGLPSPYVIFDRGPKVRRPTNLEAHKTAISKSRCSVLIAEFSPDVGEAGVG